MSTTTASKSKSYDYQWDSLQIGESHYKHRRNLQRMRDAWKAFQRKHPAMHSWEIDCNEREHGVVYRRIK